MLAIVAGIIATILVLVPRVLASSGNNVGEIIDVNHVSTSTLQNQPESKFQIAQRYALLYQVDYVLVDAIVGCESDWYQYAKNPNSSASGFFQFIDSTWTETMRRMGLPATTSKTDLEISIQAGVWLLSQDGTRHWLESKGCWAPKIHP